MCRRKTTDGKPVEHFDEACEGLLREVLSTAGLLTSELSGEERENPSRPVSVLDLGFGCGDQTLAVARLIQPSSWRDFRYVGLTLDESQLQLSIVTLHRHIASSDNVNSMDQASFGLFRANAAKPDSWSPTIRDAVKGLNEAHFKEKWLLALDCLYHFTPSRKPVFQLAAQKLDANVMAFDLILNDQASWKNTFLVRIVGLMMNCPFSTFMTEEQYKKQLVDCGYDREQIILRDISNDVFAGVASFLQRQEHALSQYGISIGGFKLAGRLFAWFDRTRVVKATVVVGRTKRE